MARIDELKADLATVRQAIRDAYSASSVSMDGRSLTRQQISELRKDEARLEQAIRRLLTGEPFGVIEFDYDGL